MKLPLIIWFTCTVGQVTGQSIQQAINDQVWKPFINAYNNHDTDGFMAVHSKDVVRSPRDAKMVLNWNEYFEQQKRGDDHGKKSGSKRELGLRFTERIANDNQAMEVGIYKVIITEKSRKYPNVLWPFSCRVEKRKWYLENISRHRLFRGKHHR